MQQKLNLLVEKPTHEEEFQYIVEQANSKAPETLYIKGPYMMAEAVNKNKRFYPKDELYSEVDRYKKEMVDTNRALGELNHPPSADVDLSNACHLVTELNIDGNFVYGKSKVLSTAPGLIVKSLINDGVSVGVSSRALGLIEEGSKFNTVRNMRLVAVDCVADPSCSHAFVNGILESKQWVLDVDGTLEENYDNFEKKISKLPRKDTDEYLRRHMLDFINKI